MSFFRTPQNSPSKNMPTTSTPSEPKIMKITAGSFETTDVWKAIVTSPSLKIAKFECLKDDAKIWIGRLENAIVSVGGVTETHGSGVLLMFLNKDDAKWHLKLTLKTPNATWLAFKQNFITDFEEECSKKLHSLFDRKKDEETMKDYVGKKIEMWSKLFPTLSSSDLNLISLIGLQSSSIKALKSHKFS